MELFFHCALLTGLAFFFLFGIPRILDWIAELTRDKATVTIFKLPEIQVPLEMPEVKPIKEEKVVIHKVTVTQEEMLRLVTDGLDDAGVFGKTFQVKNVTELFSVETKGSFEIEIEVND